MPSPKAEYTSSINAPWFARGRALIFGLAHHVILLDAPDLVEAHESDLSIASEVTQARVAEALKVGAETYEGELEMDYLSRLSPIR
jgi:hypothetical protein